MHLFAAVVSAVAITSTSLITVLSSTTLLLLLTVTGGASGRLVQGLWDNLVWEVEEGTKVLNTFILEVIVSVKYGSDKPDVRYGLEIDNVTELLRGVITSDGVGLPVGMARAAAVESERCVRLLRAPSLGGVLSRREMKEMHETVLPAMAKDFALSPSVKMRVQPFPFLPPALLASSNLGIPNTFVVFRPPIFLASALSLVSGVEKRE